MQQAGELARWEKAEIERSANEASGTDPDGLCVSDFNISRYMNPPADTPFPLEYAYHLLGDVRGKVVLDFGCGNGENTLLLVKRGAKVISMDLSQSLIELAKRRLELNGVSGDVTFLVASAHNLPLRSNSVDIVFGMAICITLTLRWQLRRCAACYERMEKPSSRNRFVIPGCCVRSGSLSLTGTRTFLRLSGRSPIRNSRISLVDSPAAVTKPFFYPMCGWHNIFLSTASGCGIFTIWMRECCAGSRLLITMPR